MDHLRKTSPGRKKRRTPERQRNISGHGMTSIRSPGITLLIVAQSSRSWLRLKPLNQMWVSTLSQK
jgi:hypothetical protein